ncbi:YeeE/YedE thiosulfate transporter family protein [Thiomicrorhabdus sp. 6S3-12]|uniref:YeeE/YedE thiosulfate transporter family protein n=1 Tax=Thiomicrorhabdus sp. 6S3-12 TaxID=2819681 RepID=UPI001FB65987|nr:YeeE/YedE thiosulfate transporter family protein [Thiomicrorhabdus sp. 6S3-12]
MKRGQHHLPLLQGGSLTFMNFVHAYRINILGLLMGVLFGFLMSRAGATTFDFHAKMFLFEDFQLMEVIGTAVIIAIIGVFIMKKLHVNAIATGTEVDFVKKPYQQGLIAGAFLFGVGWAMTAACPGTIPAMIAEGKIGAVFSLIGLLLGTLAYGILQSFIANNGSYSAALK